MRKNLIRGFLYSITLLAFGSASLRALAQEVPSIRVQPNAPGWVTVYWSHSGYNVYYFAIQRQDPPYSDRSIVVAFTTAAPSGQWTNAGLNANTTYKYRVCAVSGTSPTCSGWASATTQAAPASTSGTVAPIISGHDDAPDSITIRWTSSESYGSYNVRWAEKGHAEAQDEIGTSGTSGSHTVGGLQPNRDYLFKVQGCHRTLYGSSCGYWSATLQVTTPVPPPPPPTAPVLSVSSPDPRRIIISWSVSAAQQITHTLIQRDRATYRDSAGAIIQLDDQAVRPNTEYRYRVYLTNRVGTASNEVTAMGKPIIPSAPGNVTFSKIRVPSGRPGVAMTLRPVISVNWRNGEIPGQFVTVEREDRVMMGGKAVVSRMFANAWLEIQRIIAKTDPTGTMLDIASASPANPMDRPGNNYRVCALVPALGAAGKVCSPPTTVP